VGTLAYSRPEGRRYRLVVDGQDAPVQALRRPFDVDLGTDARGRTVAVYTRDGRVRVLDLSSGRDRALRGVRGDAPSVSRGRVLYNTTSRRDRLRLTSLAGGRGRALPSVPAGKEELTVGETELAGGVLAFTAEEETGDEVSNSQLWFGRVGRRARVVFRGVNSVNQATELIGPQVSSSYVGVALDHIGDGGEYSRLVRVSPRRGEVQRAVPEDAPDRGFEEGESTQRVQLGFAFGPRGSVFTSTCNSEESDVPDCRLVRQDTVAWRG